MTLFKFSTYCTRVICWRFRTVENYHLVVAIISAQYCVILAQRVYLICSHSNRLAITTRSERVFRNYNNFLHTHKRVTCVIRVTTANGKCGMTVIRARWSHIFGRYTSLT